MTEPEALPERLAREAWRTVYGCITVSGPATITVTTYDVEARAAIAAAIRAALDEAKRAVLLSTIDTGVSGVLSGLPFQDAVNALMVVQERAAAAIEALKSTRAPSR